MARNPRTGDPVRVPARAVPVFKPSRLFKEEVAAAPKEAESPAGDFEAPPSPPFMEPGGGGFRDF
jgi:hypothetical protein